MPAGLRKQGRRRTGREHFGETDQAVPHPPMGPNVTADSVAARVISRRLRTPACRYFVSRFAAKEYVVERLRSWRSRAIWTSVATSWSNRTPSSSHK